MQNYQLSLLVSLVAEMVKHLPAMQETGFDPWVGKIPWRREWLPTWVFLPEESHEQSSLVGYMGLQRVGHDWATNISIICSLSHLKFNLIYI